ncbi:hypothetical protein BGZ60DRAFT_523390 [Tricladium varicosporioides]|nr:hypothetical protein BGZ60DRAFT_523390 [Hymenoscyphus varicosporioides]
MSANEKPDLFPGKRPLSPILGASGKVPSLSSVTRPLAAHASKSFNDAIEKGEDHITIDVQPMTFDHPNANEPVTDPLNVFHEALGIPPPKPVKPKRTLLGKEKIPKPHEKKPKQPKLTAANKGVYHQVLNNERWARYKYQFCDFLLTGAMFLQIVVGAAVTALGAGSANHILITVFGAANTALASLLAVMKSQGLPNRLRQDWNGWRELREYIEEKEREIEMLMQGFGKPEEIAGLDVWALIREIEARYRTMRLTLEANRPDTYIKVPPMPR